MNRPAARTGDRTNLLVGLITLVALLLRLPLLTQSLWYDELWSTRLMLGSVGSLVRVAGADVHPPAYTLLMFVWIRLFGDSEISVRLIPLVAGLASIVLTARLAIDYGWRSAAPIAALILAVAPTHIWYSQEARPYTFTLALAVAAVLAFHGIQQTGAARCYATYALLAVTLAFTHYFAIAYIGVLTVLAWPDRRIRVQMLWIGAGIAALLGAFLIVKSQIGLVVTEAGYLRRFTVRDLWTLPFEWLLTGGALGTPASRTVAARAMITAAQVVFLVLVVRGLLAAPAAKAEETADHTPLMRVARRTELPLLVGILPLALLTLGLLGVQRFYIERSALPMLPFLAVAIAIGAAAARGILWRAAGIAAIVVFGAVTLASYYAKAEQWTVFRPHADWRAVAARLSDEHAQSGRPLVVVSMGPANELTYYQPGFALARLDDPPGPSTSGAAGMRARLARAFALPPDPEAGQVGRIYEPTRPDTSIVHGILDREQTAEIFLTHNAYWPGESVRMIAAVKADRRLRVETIFQAKGVQLLRIRRIT